MMMIDSFEKRSIPPSWGVFFSRSVFGRDRGEKEVKKHSSKGKESEESV